MIHFLLLIVCILSIEVIIRLRFFSLFDSILNLTKKVTHVIPHNNISDHWKEKVIPIYALRMMKYSLQILLILLLIISFFVLADIFFNNLLALTFSLIGVVESIIFAFGYVHLRKYL